MDMRFLDHYNAVAGMIATVASAMLGQFWYLFALFLLFNVIDWLTGWYKARKLGGESSSVGIRGILKKLGYWAIVVVAFAMPLALIKIGEMIGVKLSFLELLGWFTLASLMVNEIRSILENLVEAGYDVPPFLMKGLAITQKLLEDESEYPKTEQPLKRDK